MSQQAEALEKLRLDAMSKFVQEYGHSLVPVTHTETINGSEIKLGQWVSYLRTRYRNGQLNSDRVATMESFPGWQWGPLRPGPKPDRSRNAEILEMRSAGKSLQEIGSAFGLSRQRIHQILKAANNE